MLTTSASTLPFAEAFISPKWLQFDMWRHNIRRSRDNALRSHEEALRQELLKMGREDLASAVQGGVKYHRLNHLVEGFPPYYEGAVGLRTAFNPEAHIPASKEEWVAEALARYANDAALQQIVIDHKQYLCQNTKWFNSFFERNWNEPVGCINAGHEPRESQKHKQIDSAYTATGTDTSPDSTGPTASPAPAENPDGCNVGL
jgi:hypothetical protein